MADEDRGYPTRQDTQRDDVLTTVTAAIMSGFSGLQSDLSAMRKLLEQANKADTKYKFSGGSIDNLYTDIKSATKVLAEFEKRVKSTANSISQERESWNKQSASFSGKSDIERLYAQKRSKAASDAENKLAELYEKSQEDISKIQENYDAILAKRKELVGDREKTIDDLEKDLISISFKIQETRDANLKATLENEKAIAEQLIEQERQLISNEAKELDAELSKFTKEKEDAVKESSKAVEQIRSDLREFKENLDDQYSATLRAAEDALSGTASLRGQSAWASKYMQSEEDLETPDDKIAKSIAKQIDTNETAMRNILKLMETATDEDKRVLQKQYDYLSQQTQNLREWTPAREQFSKSVKTLGDAAKNIISSIGKTVLKRFEDYYLNSYEESFQKVYDSVENTRNTVSARLKLDQGGFSEMQEEIQAEIEAQGLESSITQADVNDALVSLSAAGVTDKEMLKALALEQAKLAASGSSLNIGNEETLNNIRQMYQAQIQQGATQGEAIDGIMNLLDRVAAQQREIGTTGWDSSLVNGQMDQIFNQMSEIGIAGQKSMDEMAKDITAAMQYSEHYYGMGLDPNELYQYIKDISQGTVASNSTFEKVLQVQGIDRNAILEKGIDELYSEISTILQDVASTGDTKYRAEVLQAFGLSMTPLDAEKLANGVATIQTTSLEQLDATNKQTQIDLQNGTYLSKTQTHQNEAANSMAEIAIEAEKQYKGNEYVLAGFDAVTNGLNAIENIASDILTEMLFSNGTHALNGENLSNFMTGKSGTAAGVAGKTVGAAVGVGLAGSAIYDAVSENAQNGAMEVAIGMTEDPKFWAGVGTTVGSVIGGPAGGAVVGGAMGAATVLGEKITSTKLGNEIVSGISDALTFGLIHDTEEDPTFVAARELSESTNEQFLAAQEQINAAQEMLETYSKMSDGEKKLELLKKKVIDDDGKVIDASRLATMETEELNKLFEDNLVKEQENIITQQQQLKAEQEAILAKSSQIAEANLLMTESGTGNIADDRARFEGAMGGKQISDIYSSLDMSGMDDSSLIQYIISSGYSGSIQNLKNKSSDELIKMAQQSKLASFSSQAGFSEYTSDVMNESFKMWQNRKEKYEEADAKFAEKLSNYAETDGKEYADDPFNLAMNYAIKYIKEEKDQNTFMNAVEKSLSETGSIHLDDNGGYYLKDYREGVHFASGLTNVPYDNYPALLHEGERILTAKEAQAYNEMSSFAVSNLINTFNDGASSSNVFSTTSYGIDFDKSIGTQTDVISKKLDQVISAIEKLNISLGNTSRTSSASYQNVVRGNSNITQLNTL